MDLLKNMFINETLAGEIKQMRLSAHMTQAQLAASLGTCRQHIQKWEYGYIKPRPARLEDIIFVTKGKKDIDTLFADYYME